MARDPRQPLPPTYADLRQLQMARWVWLPGTRAETRRKVAVKLITTDSIFSCLLIFSALL